VIKEVNFCANYVQTFGLKTPKSIKNQEWNKMTEKKSQKTVDLYVI
jgi:hypothetical protein